MSKLEQVAPGLRRWSAWHSEWRQEVGSVAVDTPDGLVLSVGAVEKHVASILQKLRLPPSDTDHRRVLAVLAYLQEQV